MSVDFVATVKHWPTYDELRSRIAPPAPACWGEEPASGPWPEGQVYLYLPGVSTRAVEVLRDGDRLTVTVRACSCEEDWQLALRVLEALVADREQRINADVYGELSLGELRGRVDPPKAVTGSLSTLIALIDGEAGRLSDAEGPEVLSMPGPGRSYALGPRRLAELRARASEESLPLAILEDIRRVRYADLGDRHEANVLVTTTGERMTFAVWGERCAALLPDAQRYVIDVAQATKLLIIPAKALQEVAGPLFEGWLDESSALVRESTAEEWAALIERARPVAEDLAPTRRPRRWWQFWKR